MEQLVREGEVTYVGSSNFAGWDIATAQSVAARRTACRTYPDGQDEYQVADGYRARDDRRAIKTLPRP
jgi:aryl-alcohol dehydrogenase-like predicted oxidoreductase